ncbi:MAG: BamA/TamA family outer membrane protein [Paludibacteraceae bacterium]|nr:BamA/TamA family outer membrane protein [Paludibacteraceae bacterium]
MRKIFCIVFIFLSIGLLSAQQAEPLDSTSQGSTESHSNVSRLDSLTSVSDSLARVADSLSALIGLKPEKEAPKEEVPVITYSFSPKEYVVADISVEGAGNYDKNVIVNYSGLRKGMTVKMPGDDFSQAIKRFWKQGLFSDVKIIATKVVDNKVWLQISLKPRPRISEVNFYGLKKKEKEDLETGVGLTKGNQISPNQVDRARTLIKRKLESNGYEHADVELVLRDDPANPGEVIVDVNVDKKGKVKVHRIYIDGNSEVKDQKLKSAMKKTKERKLRNIFKSKKFIREEYANDKGLLIDKFNEKGFRDAEILSDSVVSYKENRVDIYLKVYEGKRYYFRNITWVGNTIYSNDALSKVLGIKKGDVYNQKLLTERLTTDDDAVASLYLDNGYLFFNIDPVEVNIDGDSIDMEMRIYEGKQATINEVVINGNTDIYEHVVRRELRTKPGQLFSKSDLQRSARELAASGHFDPEKMDIRPVPNPEEGTVDIVYNLEQKRNDQAEVSFGWGQTGVTGSLGLKFNNFSIQNIFNKEAYRPLPQGDGQTLSLSFQTNASYYNAASISFTEPWLGGSRPTSLTTSLFWAHQTGVNSSFYSDYYNRSYYDNGSYNSYYAYASDPNKYITTIGTAVGIGKRLPWPDDYFSLYTELAYRHYDLQNWSYFDLETGQANNLSLGLTLSRNSIDNPYYSRRGSLFSISLQATPPYSMFKGDNAKLKAQLAKYGNGSNVSIEDQADYLDMQQELYGWVEYWKTEFKSKTFTPLSPNQKLVLMTRVEYGFLGYYDRDRRSPFERYYVGGDGMTGSSSTYATTSVALRGYGNGSLTPRDWRNRTTGNLYSKLSMELRYPLMLQPTSTIYLLSFMDAGNAWSEFSEFSPFDLKRSVGGGVRVFLPMIGLIGVDVGYGFDEPYVRGDGGWNFHLVIGQEQ